MSEVGPENLFESLDDDDALGLGSTLSVLSQWFSTMATHLKHWGKFKKKKSQFLGHTSDQFKLDLYR